MNARPAMKPGERWPVPTEQECWQSCVENAQAAAKALASARETYRAMMPGDLKLNSVRSQIAQHGAEQKHWDGLARWYQQRTRITRVVPMRDPRLPREPGEDDE